MKRDSIRWKILAFLLLSLFWTNRAHLAAQGMVNVIQPAKDAKPVDRNQPRTTEFTVYPAVEPIPALKYELLPNILDRKPGNAAILYNKLALQFAEHPRKEAWEKIYQWLPPGPALSELPLEEVRATLSEFQQELDDIAMASRREECDWQLPLKERFMFTILLPELQNSRQMARLLAMQARLQIAEGRHEEALQTLKSGYAVGEHVGSSPVIVGSLVGMAITGIMSEQLGDLIQQPQAPSLYWALSGLPRPLVSMAPGMEAERQMLYLSYPQLLDVHQAEGTPEYWRQLLDDTLGQAMTEASGGFADDPLMSRLALTGMAFRGYPMARQHLIDAGRSVEEVDKMPISQVVMIYTLDVYNEYRDETFKWFSLPYYEAREGIKKTEERLKKEGGRREIVPMASLLLPAISSAKLAEARTDRRIAMLRIVEALRLHAGAHQGRLPNTLDEVTEVPIPFDPVSGKPFGYKVQGNTATLDGYPPEGMSARNFGARFEITMAKQ